MKKIKRRFKKLDRFVYGKPSPYNPLNYVPPSAREIRRMREKAFGTGLGVAEAARVIGKEARAWKYCETAGGVVSRRAMSFADFALFSILALGMNPERFRGGMPQNIPGLSYRGFHKVQERSSGSVPKIILRKTKESSPERQSREKDASYNPLNYVPPTRGQLKKMRSKVESKGVSQIEAARVIGMGPRTWQKYESDPRVSNYRSIPFSELALFRILALGEKPSRFLARPLPRSPIVAGRLAR